MKTCPYCLSQLPDDAETCPGCGYKLDAKPEAAAEASGFTAAAQQASEPTEPQTTYDAYVAQNQQAQDTPEPPYSSYQQSYDTAGQQVYAPESGKSNVVAGLLGIFLGSLGIHKFYLGYNKQGLIMLLVSLLTFGVGAVVMEIIGFIEGIIYLCKSKEDFHYIYEVGNKPWF